MHILWVGDYAPTGFGKITFNMCSEFVRLGHTVSVLGISYHGDTVNTDGRTFEVYSPTSGADYTADIFGVGRLPHLINRLHPDIVIIQQDPWNIPGYISTVSRAFDGKIPVPMIGFLAVDSENHNQTDLDGLDLAVFWTEFGAAQFRESEVERAVNPLGIDLNLFTSERFNKSDSRRRIFGEVIPSDTYIVGVIARNQWRKRLDLSIAAFAEFRRELMSSGRPSPYLYIHALPAHPPVDIPRIIKHYDLLGYAIGLSGNNAVTDAVMVDIYNSLDCYLSTSAGEGWNYPAQEALISGLPIVVPNNSALAISGGWIPDCADNRTFRVDCNAPQVLAPYGDAASYTVGSVPDLGGTVEALHAAYMATEYDDVDSADDSDKLTDQIRASMVTWEESAGIFDQLITSTREKWESRQDNSHA